MLINLFVYCEIVTRARRASIPRLPALFVKNLEGRRSIQAELRAHQALHYANPLQKGNKILTYKLFKCSREEFNSKSYYFGSIVMQSKRRTSSNIVIW